MKTLTARLSDTLAGNSRAFNEVVRQFQEEALRKAFSRLGDSELARDAVQEAFLAAYLNLPTLRDLARFPGWFRAVLTSCISRAGRKSRSERSWMDIDDAEAVLALAPSEYDVVARREIIGWVRRAVAGLPPKTREICTLFYFDGYTQKEIAGFVNVPLGTVKRRLHDARRQIRRYLHERHLVRSIRVGFMPISDHLLAMVSRHLTDPDDLQIELQKFLSWSALTNAIRRGLVDAAFIQATQALSLKNEGVGIRYILDAGHNGSAITIRGGIGSTRKLSEVRLGLPMEKSTQHSLLHFLLDDASMLLGPKVSTSCFNPSYIIGALKNNQIDAFFCAEPWNTKAVYEGVGRILVRSGQIVQDHICCIVVVNANFASRHGDIVRLYINRLLAAQQYAWKHPRRCSVIQSKYTGIHAQIAEDVIRKGYVTFSDLFPVKTKIAHTMAMAMAAGTLDKQCDLDGFIAREFL
jgi:NitT/TauT family transport system substrate-binding protein